MFEQKLDTTLSFFVMFWSLQKYTVFASNQKIEGIYISSHTTYLACLLNEWKQFLAVWLHLLVTRSLATPVIYSIKFLSMIF